MRRTTTTERTARSQLTGYCDASYANDKDQRRSTTGYIFFLGNSVICWKSSSQKRAASSTAEAEYYAVHEAVKEALFLRKLLRVLRLRTRNSANLLRQPSGDSDDQQQQHDDYKDKTYRHKTSCNQRRSRKEGSRDSLRTFRGEYGRHLHEGAPGLDLPPTQGEDARMKTSKKR